MHIAHVPTFHFVSETFLCDINMVIRVRVYVYDSVNYEIMYMTT